MFWTNINANNNAIQKKSFLIFQTLSVQFSPSVVSDSSRPHELQHTRPPCPSPTPGVHSDSSPSSEWCHPAISSSGVPFSSCPQSLPASESFPMSQLCAWGGQKVSQIDLWLFSGGFMTLPGHLLLSLDQSSCVPFRHILLSPSVDEVRHPTSWNVDVTRTALLDTLEDMCVEKDQPPKTAWPSFPALRCVFFCGKGDITDGLS